MPEPLAIDRELVRSLWLQGFTHREIEERTGVKSATLRAWIVRLGWKHEGVVIRPAPDTLKIPDMQASAERLAQLTVEQCERILCRVRDSRLDTIKECRDSAAALSAAYAAARRALGLDAPQLTGQLHLHYSGVPKPQPRVIDVSATSHTD